MGSALAHMINTPNIFSLGLLGLALGVAILWLIIRKKEHRVWIPTLRILPLESRILPKMVLQIPPLVPFLCFLGLLGTVTFLSTKPKVQVFRSFDPNQSKHLIFVDFSPSVSRSMTLEELKNLAKTTCEQLISFGKVQAATSHKKTIFIIENCDEFSAILQNLDYHRPGLKLGEAFKKLLTPGVDFDQIYIISDRDQHTWIDFNWHFLNNEADVYLVNIPKPLKDSGNIFINGAQMLTQLQASANSPTSEWDIEISRTNEEEEEISGVLTVKTEDLLLKEQAFTLSPGRKRQTIRVDWQSPKTPQTPQTPTTSIEPTAGDHPRVAFQIIEKNNQNKNAIALDDQFYAPFSNKRRNITIIAENSGEQALEDPLGPLLTSLETLGFTTERKDYILGSSQTFSTRDLLIVAGGSSSQAEQFCPSNPSSATTSSAPPKSVATQGKVWLAPLHHEVDYFELCRCLGRLLPSSSSFQEAACEHVHTRKDWVTLLPSIGGKQMGGTLGTHSDALAYFFKTSFHKDIGTTPKEKAESPEKQATNLIVFTLPLVPHKTMGISFAKLPLLVRDLLIWQGLYDNQTASTKTQWPRFADIAGDLWDRPELAKLAQLSNVPVGESDLNEMEASDLPPIWDPSQNSQAKTAPMKRDLDDPVPWIKIIFTTFAVLTSLELLYWIMVRLSRIIRLRAAPLWIAAFLSWNHEVTSYAKVEFGVYGNKDFSLTIKILSKEVAARTSIELTPTPFSIQKIDDQSLALPWIWISDLKGLLTPGGSQAGTLHRDLIMWLKRGGFLVIETNLPTAQLQQITRSLGGDAQFPWLPLPPDHELMRSFYLIDALPDCNGEIWRGLQFDGRLAILAIPYGFLDSLKDQRQKSACGRPMDQEYSTRVFINLIMVALATDYKKDQIHLPEILKRLR